MRKQITIRAILTVCLVGLTGTTLLAGNPASSPHSSKGGRPSAANDVVYASKTTRKEYSPKSSGDSVASTQKGKASYYGGKWHGGKTASGEIYNKESMTAAHRSLPFGSRVRVTNLRNGRSVILRINNRGPFVAGRIIDVSEAAARKLGMIKAGVVSAKVEVLR